MNRLLIVVAILFFTLGSFAQVEKKPTPAVAGQPTNAVSYRLFPTQNNWTFIKLNTRTGQMWQVQFSMKSETRFVSNLSSEASVSKDNEINDRFTLYPTQNMHTFILLDQLDGKTWQVQWSVEAEYRAITPIE